MNNNMEWQPIETAPKDWSNLILFCPEHHYCNDGGVMFGWFDEQHFCFVGRIDGNHLHEAVNPTHWMPLPPAPKAK